MKHSIVREQLFVSPSKSALRDGLSACNESVGAAVEMRESQSEPSSGNWQEAEGEGTFFLGESNTRSPETPQDHYWAFKASWAGTVIKT